MAPDITQNNSLSHVKDDIAIKIKKKCENGLYCLESGMVFEGTTGVYDLFFVSVPNE